MPLFALMGRDGPNAAALRATHRPAHLEHLRPVAAAGRVRFAGPLLDDAGAPCGSLVVFEADDLAAARALAARDPYVVNGVFASHEVRATRDVSAELRG
jgi:uncharacterized protein YciI